jgi:hypothetical protein
MASESKILGPWPSTETLRKKLMLYYKGKKGKISLEKFFEIPFNATEKRDGSNVSICYDPKNNKFLELRSRKQVLQTPVLNLQDLSRFFSEETKNKIRQLWNILRDPTLDEEVTSLIVFGEVYTHKLNFNYGKKYFWEVFGFKLVKTTHPSGKTFWLTDSVLEMFNQVGLKTPPLIAKGTLCDIIPCIHEKMMNNAFEGVVFSPSLEPDYPHGFKYKIGLMDDCPVTYFVGDKKLSEIDPAEKTKLISEYGKEIVEMFFLVDQVFFNGKKISKKKRPNKKKKTTKDKKGHILFSMVTKEVVLSELSKQDYLTGFTEKTEPEKKEIIKSISVNVYLDIVKIFSEVEKDYLIPKKITEIMIKKIITLTKKTIN